MDYEWWYIRSHTNEKPCKSSNITFAILPFYQEKFQTEWPPDSWVLWNLQLTMNRQMHFNMVHFNIKNAKFRVG